MKKILWIALILILVCVFSLSACNNSNSNDDGTNNNTNQNPNESSHTHSFDEWETVKNATCSSEGLQERYCSCGEKQTRTLSVTDNHSFGEWRTVKNATCTQDGEKERSCSCGTTEKQKIQSSGHTEVIDQEVSASCTTNGLTQGKHCSVCGTVIVAQQTIQAGHTEVIDQEVSATCTKEGKTQGKHCSKCGTILQAQTSTPKIDHNYLNGKCTMCSATEPIKTKYFTFGDTVSFHYEYGSSNGDFTVSLGSSYTKITYTANKYIWVYGQQFVRIPMQITNDSDSTDSLTISLIKLYDSNNNSNNPENGIYSNQIVSDNTFDDGHIFDDIRPHSTYSGAVYIPYTGAGTYALVIKDTGTIDYIFEFEIQ